MMRAGLPHRACRDKQKARLIEPGLLYATLPTRNSTQLNSTQLNSFRLCEQRLERLVGFLGEIGIELTDLRSLGHKPLIGGLGVLGLNLDRLVERLHAEKLLERGAAVLERLLRIVRNLDCNRLGAFRKRTQGFKGHVHIVFADLLEVVEILDHVIPSGPLGGANVPNFEPGLARNEGSYTALHNKVKLYYCSA